mmetsp:Transcript_52797/g.170171  ORF Transcript_52797/g.170171 Transcript_52797/m.170171 type:complete len:420 (-) Transcript_52797:239-1498(-)
MVSSDEANRGTARIAESLLPQREPHRGLRVQSRRVEHDAGVPLARLGVEKHRQLGAAEHDGVAPHEQPLEPRHEPARRLLPHDVDRQLVVDQPVELRARGRLVEHNLEAAPAEPLCEEGILVGGEGGAEEGDAPLAGQRGGGRVCDVEDGHSRDGAAERLEGNLVVDAVAAHEERLAPRRSQREAGASELLANLLPPLRKLELDHGGLVEGEEDGLRRMPPAEPLPHPGVDPSVVVDRRGRREAADQADSTRETARPGRAPERAGGEGGSSEGGEGGEGELSGGWPGEEPGERAVVRQRDEDAPPPDPVERLCAVPLAARVLDQQRLSGPEAASVARAYARLDVPVEGGDDLAARSVVPLVVVAAVRPAEPDPVAGQTLGHLPNVAAAHEGKGDGAPARLDAVVLEVNHLPRRRRATRL